MTRQRPFGPATAGALAVMVLAVMLVSGCGGSSPSTARPAPKATEFPATQGRTLAQIVGNLEQSPLVASPAGQVFDLGEDRYSFGVFTKGRKQVSDAEVALYFAPGKNGKAVGPFPARVESLQTPPAYRALTTAQDPSAATAVYVVPKVNFSKAGEWRAIAVFRTADGLQETLMPSAVAGGFPAIPKVGDRAPRIHTPTASSVGGDLAKIDTRIPPDQMHKVDFADALGKEPVVLLFATPQLCQSRTCGPVVDIEEEVHAELGDEAAFIHMEVYNQNDPNKGIRPQLRAFHLESEPWLFVIGADGKISTRIEGAFSPAELKAAVEKAPR